jgi:hypothetical protein
VTSTQIAGAVPELKNAGSIPNGIYVPVTDSNGNCVSDANEPMLGGVYVQGNLDSLTMSLGGGTNNLAVYTFTQGSTTTTVTVDRTANQTTVTSNAWLPPPAQPGCAGLAGPATRVFSGVPKGWQGAGGVANASMIYVEGAINSLSGTLQQNEQTTIAASGNITIQGNIQYQAPPNPSDPTSNPIEPAPRCDKPDLDLAGPAGLAARGRQVEVLIAGGALRHGGTPPKGAASPPVRPT